jgi:hypothetical protein
MNFIALLNEFVRAKCLFNVDYHLMQYIHQGKEEDDDDVQNKAIDERSI